MQSGSNIHTLPITILTFNDHFTQVNADANFDAIAFREIVVALHHATLKRGGTFDSIDYTAELR